MFCLPTPSTHQACECGAAEQRVSAETKIRKHVSCPLGTRTHPELWVSFHTNTEWEEEESRGERRERKREERGEIKELSYLFGFIRNPVIGFRDGSTVKVPAFIKSCTEEVETNGSLGLTGLIYFISYRSMTDPASKKEKTKQ